MKDFIPPITDLGAKHTDTEGMLRLMNLTARSVGIVLVGVFTFTERWPGAGYGALVIVAYALTLALVPWAIAEDWRPGRYESLLGYGLGLLCLVCGAGYGTPTGGALLVVCFMVSLSAGRSLAPARAWIVPALGVAGAAAIGLTGHHGVWQSLGYPGILLPAAFILGNNIRVHRVEAERSAQLVQEQTQVATLRERARIAREIHDVLAHSLGALGLQIELIEAVLTDSGDVPHAVELLEQAHRMATGGLSETRRAVHALRGETPPLPDGLAQLSIAHQRRHGAEVTFEVTGEPRSLPPEARLAITRTAQEALVNTAKYAPHQPIVVRLDYSGAGTSLVVTSRLASEASSRTLNTVNGGYGLAGLRERLLLQRGTLTAGCRGGDWVVEATVPA